MFANPRHTLFHLVLVMLSMLFALPFVWMVSTSLKADEEVIHDPMVWIPEMPMRVKDSPYLDSEAHPPRWHRPQNIPVDQWPVFVEQLTSAMRHRAKELFNQPTWPNPKDPLEPALFERAGYEISDALWLVVSPRIPEPVWADLENAIPYFLERIETEDVVKAWQRIYRSLAIGEIHLRNGSAEEIGRAPRPDNDRIQYRVKRGLSRVHLVSREIRLASPEEKLDQIMVRVRPDNSYHRLEADLVYRGRTYQTETPDFLDGEEYQDFFWKFTPQVKYDIEHLTFVEKKETISGSLPPPDVVRMDFYLVPTPYYRVLWERLANNYYEVFKWVPFGTYTWVTIRITALNILGQLLACSMVGFAFARLRFPGRNLLFLVMLGTMMLPPQVTMIPQFIEFSWIGAYNTLFPLYILSFFGAPFFIFLIRQFFMSIPVDLTDAAKIDGCGYFRIYWQVLLPLVKPALAAIAIFQFQNSWNEFLQPLIYITDEELTPISVGLFMFRQSHGGDWAELMAASSLMTLPIIFLFFFTQRYFIQGITLTGLKD